VGFPILAMPPGAQLWAKALPYTHYIRVQIEQLQMGAPLHYSVPAPLWMLVATLCMGLAAAQLLRVASGQPDTWGKR
jgi:ABC-2 type transport system permease protein